MTEKVYKHGDHEDFGFEQQDLDSRNIYVFLITLAVVAAMILVILYGFYRFVDAYWRDRQPAQNPLVKVETDTRAITPADIAKFPQPRLETNEQNELNGLRISEQNTLHSYGWVDQKAGTVHIPIDRAMQLIVQRGLPTRPQAAGSSDKTSPSGRHNVPAAQNAAGQQALSKKQPTKPASRQ